MGGAREENISFFLVFFITLLAVVLVLAKKLHDRPVLASILPEGAMVLAVGMVAGFIIHLIVGKRYLAAEAAIEAQSDDDHDDDYVTKQDIDDELGALISFSPDIFFIALLPPIIFNSGLRIGPLFFRHITPIVLFAAVGTTISAFSTAFLLQGVLKLGFCGNFSPSLTELLTFGALISSTDPVSTLAVFKAKKVDPQLFYLVFGESVLNDAVAIVLFESFSKFVARENTYTTIALGVGQFLFDFFLNSVGSLFLGCLSGLLTALLFKQIDFRKNRLVEISLFLLMIYIPFLLAEILHISGIVTILFTGISANRYVVPNLSTATKDNADMLFRLLAHLAETSIFLELGLSVFGLIGHFDWAFIGWSLLACFIARALNVYPIVLLFNRFLLRDVQTSSDDSSEIFHGYVNEERVLEHHLSFDTVGSEMTATPLQRKDLKIRPKTAHMMWFTGLRGAVAYACVRTFPDTLGHQKDFTMTTMAIVLITVFVLGGTTEMTLGLLNIKLGVDEKTYMEQKLREPVVSSALHNFGE